ncbi:major facilitator superfamily domain-containing protein [Thelonectria olida]|uniref:Major facilitator superfamily domain-containing protein n=1 Tax=Thelonectria olida TaxID=1576542 RepID=A0A9P8VTT3_9HYPO|nr:major facilitator superfamily domain-containing protein [Thelonectria olida]
MGVVQHQTGTPYVDSSVDKESGAVINDNDLGQNSHSNSDGEEHVSPDAQPGVQDIQAIASVWTTRALITAYVMIWFIYFFDMLQQGVSGVLTAYVTSAFAQHSLTPTVSIMSSIIGGVFKLTIAKILDVFGRPQGYLLSLILATIGLVMMAATDNVEMYAAAQVFYTVGNNALLYTISVFIADTSSLRNRGLMTAYISSPNFATVWIAGPMSEAYLNGPGWRWCWGTFSIIIPAVTIPLFGLLMYNHSKAKKQGLVPKRESQRTAWESFIYYCREFDAVGLFLLSAGLALFLLPFNIYSMQSQEWRSPLIICLLVFGFALIIVFAIWEKYFAPITFIPYSLLLDRTVMGACVLAATLFISYYCWFSYFTSFLQVVNNLSVTDASYVSQTYTIGSCFASILVGLLIRYTGRFKPVCLYFGIPMSIFGMGLMINFRQPDVNIGYIVMCQIFIAFAGGTIIICDGIAVMAAASHQHIAVVIAVEAMFSEIGGAIGLSVAAAIWTGVFPVKLAEYLPASELPSLLDIYTQLPVQLSYPVGSPARIAIQHAYADAQKMMLIAGTAIWAVGLVATFFWRDINVKNIKQVKGHVI